MSLIKWHMLNFGSVIDPYTCGYVKVGHFLHTLQVIVRKHRILFVRRKTRYHYLVKLLVLRENKMPHIKN